MKTVTYDFHRMIPPEGATKLKCSDWGGGDAIIKHMGNSASEVEPKTKPAMARA